MAFEQNAPFMNMTVTEGNGIVNGQPVKKGDHFIVCSDQENVTYDGVMTFMITTL